MDDGRVNSVAGHFDLGVDVIAEVAELFIDSLFEW
jgi:hypothetical protein